jgi:hypothetical protein
MVPYLLGGLTIRPARGQAADAAIDVIVLDFSNRSRVGGSLIGKSAAAAVALELQQSGRWNPVQDRAVQEAANRLNLRPPFDAVALTRLATAVDASLVIVGEVLSVKLMENPAQATVQVAIQAFDRASAEMVNGAVATGKSAPRIGYTGDTSILIDEALSNAAFLARQHAERYQSVHGTVLNTSVVGDNYEALLNIGARQGVKLGMRFIILRREDLVGRGRVRAVDPDFSTLAIQENFQGVKPEDVVRAIFQLPPLSRDVSEAEGVRTVALQQPADPNQPGPGDVVLPEVSPKSKQNKPSMNQGARLLAGGLLLLGLFALAGRRGGTQVFGASAQSTTFGDQPAILVNWKRPREVSSEDVVQYQIVRGNALQGECAVGVVIGDQREFLDTLAATPDQRNLGSLLTAGTGGAGGNTGIGIPACADADLPIVPGRTYTYRVQTVFFPPVDLSGGMTTPTQLISDPSQTSSPVTALALPTLNAPADGASGIDLSAVNFQFTSVAGATSYTVQVATDAGFQSGQEVTRVANADALGAELLSTGPLNLVSRFGGRTLLFWRVGAINSRDGATPVGGGVFSLARSFSPATP